MTAAGDPADRVTLDESVSMALLVVLERLVTTPGPDVVWRGNGGGKVASRPGAQGAERVAAALLVLTRWPPRQIAMGDDQRRPRPGAARRRWRAVGHLVHR